MKTILPIPYLSTNKSIKKSLQLVLISLFLFNSLTKAQVPADPTSIIGKVVCGYQGWFNCTGDGSPINHWSHWSPGNPPQPGIAPNPNPNLTFDAYPDVSIYNPASLFQTNFANQGNGNPAKLFSSFKEDVVNKHFELMQANGIDGVAFQRFIWEVLIDPAYKANRDSAAVHVKSAAEKYQRIFYLVYDLSGLGNVPAANDQERFDGIKNDWTTNMTGTLGLTSSTMYAKQAGKPVVQLWGIGYNHIIGSAAIQLDLINWFKAQGCYVIIGVPTGWRTGTGASNPGWLNTYKAGNMISPWSVGAYTNQAQTDSYKTSFLSPDLTFCNSNGIAYQPVIFPGFSWSNWNSGVQNQIPRNKGEFLWHQATNLKSLNIASAEIAMMDEFDEGTAILPMADGYNMIPTNQYFVTTSADGTYLSSDFYLRLASKATRVIKGLDGVTTNVTIPYSLGPIFFRTSNEAKYDPMPSWTSTTEYKTNVTAYGSNSGNPTCATILANPRAGLYSLKFAGRDRSNFISYAYFRVWDVNIPVSSTTELNFWNYPLNALGRYVSLDLIMTDGTTLRDSRAVDANGISMHPATGRGSVNTWTKTTCNIGSWLNGITIDKILVAYDHSSQTGDFSGYIDDVSINTASTPQFFISSTKLLFSAKPIKNDVQLSLQVINEMKVKLYEVERSVNGTQYSATKTLWPTLNTGTKIYAVTDANALANFGTSEQFYYRIKTVELNGSVSYSKIISINKAELAQKIHILSNPFRNYIDLKLSIPIKDKLLLQLFDAGGKLMISKKYNNTADHYRLNTPIALNKGIYILKIIADDTPFSNTIIKD